MPGPRMILSRAAMPSRISLAWLVARFHCRADAQIVASPSSTYFANPAYSHGAKRSASTRRLLAHDAQALSEGEPQATAVISEAGPPTQPPDMRSLRLDADSDDPAAAATIVPAAAWAQLDLKAELAVRLPTMQAVPLFWRPAYGQHKHVVGMEQILSTSPWFWSTSMCPSHEVF